MGLGSWSPASAQVQQAWVAQYPGAIGINNHAAALKVDGAANVYITGVLYASTDASSADYATLKYDATGNLLWIRRYNGSGDSFDYPTGLALDNAGNVYVTGQSVGTNAYADYATIK